MYGIVGFYLDLFRSLSSRVWSVVHPHWTDQVSVYSNGRFARSVNNDGGSWSASGNTIALGCDQWETESLTTSDAGLEAEKDMLLPKLDFVGKRQHSSGGTTEPRKHRCVRSLRESKKFASRLRRFGRG